MGKRKAVAAFVGVCILLAVLLVVHSITPLVSGPVFAVSLVGLGTVSGGFRK